jgi:hydrogenase expression/formation protein HypC
MCLGIPGRIIEIRSDGSDGTMAAGTVDFNGVKRDVCLAYVPGIKVGDYAIVHVGFAISVVDEEEAKRTYAVLEEMSQLDELEWMSDLIPEELKSPGAVT